MDLSEAQEELLVLLHSWRRGALPPTVERIEQAAARDGVEVDVAGTVEVLAAGGLVARTAAREGPPRYALTELGWAEATPRVKRRYADGFSDKLVRLEASPTYRALCARVHGRDLCQFDMMDVPQLELLLDTLALGPRRRVLDLGCATGRIAEHLSDRTGAHVTGIDIASGAIACALSRTAGKRDRLSFDVQDMDDLTVDGPFDVIVAVDTLYFVEDLPAVVARIASLLAPGGRLATFWSTIRPVDGSDAWGGVAESETRLARALQEAGLAWTSHDFTIDERAHWAALLEACGDLRERFEAEGNGDLCEGMAEEAKRCAEACVPGRHSRFLYVAHQRP